MADILKMAAMLELNLLRWLEILPADPFEGTTLGAGVPVCDDTGVELYLHTPIKKDYLTVGFANVATNDILGSVILKVGEGWAAREPDLRAKARNFLRLWSKETWSEDFDGSLCLLSYSYPKLAIRVMGPDGEEHTAFEWGSDARVPLRRKHNLRMPPSYFERWSVVEATPPNIQVENKTRHKSRIEFWGSVAQSAGLNQVPDTISANFFQSKLATPLNIKKESECRQAGLGSQCSIAASVVVGQKDPVWCVPASCEMLLDYFKIFSYKQEDIATFLGLGRLGAATRLEVGGEPQVESGLKQIAGGLDLDLKTDPVWEDFARDLDNDRPIISFISGHARAVVGYVMINVGFGSGLELRGLKVLDPWPVNQGTRTPWEDFDGYNHYRVNISAGAKASAQVVRLLEDEVLKRVPAILESSLLPSYFARDCFVERPRQVFSQSVKYKVWMIPLSVRGRLVGIFVLDLFLNYLDWESFWETEESLVACPWLHEWFDAGAVRERLSLEIGDHEILSSPKLVYDDVSPKVAWSVLVRNAKGLDMIVRISGDKLHWENKYRRT